MKEGRLLKTDSAEYHLADWCGNNKSGFSPLGDMVIVLPDVVAPKTRGGVMLTEDKIWEQQESAITGTVVELGESSFIKTTEGAPWTGRKPKPGDRVYFQKYAGQIIPGKDGRRYRAMSQACIGAVEKTEESYT
jgi:chaperonin GroES